MPFSVRSVPRYRTMLGQRLFFHERGLATHPPTTDQGWIEVGRKRGPRPSYQRPLPQPLTSISPDTLSRWTKPDLAKTRENNLNLMWKDSLRSYSDIYGAFQVIKSFESRSLRDLQIFWYSNLEHHKLTPKRQFDVFERDPRQPCLSRVPPKTLERNGSRICICWGGFHECCSKATHAFLWKTWFGLWRNDEWESSSAMALKVFWVVSI